MVQYVCAGVHQHYVNIYQVKAFCDVDENKIQKGFYTYEESKVRSADTYSIEYNMFIKCLLWKHSKQGYNDISCNAVVKIIQLIYMYNSVILWWCD